MSLVAACALYVRAATPSGVVLGLTRWGRNAIGGRLPGVYDRPLSPQPGRLTVVRKRGPAMYKSILVPLDGSPLAEAALPFAESLAERAGASLVLVRATHAHPTLGNNAPEQQREIAGAEDYLTILAKELAGRGFSVQTGVPYGGSAAAWIVEEVSMRDADLVVMATHDRSGADRWLHGSVAEAVVSRATAPVLLIRARSSPRAIERFGDQPPVLVVALDGSPLAEAALPGASDLARTLGGRIVLVTVVPTPG